MDMDHLADLQVTGARAWMRRRAFELCNGDDLVRGIGKLAPDYVMVTEGRDHRGNWRNYSSCGDLVQRLAFELGLRDGTINREEHKGWTIEHNLLRFYSRAHRPDRSDPVAVTPSKTYEPACGDVGFVWLTGNDAHTFVFGERIDERRIETFNYGASGMTPIEFPGGLLRKSVVVKNAAGLWQVGPRILHKVAAVPALLSRADTEHLPEWWT